MAQLDSVQIEYIDAMNSCVRRTVTLLRAAADATNSRDRENLTYYALEVAEEGERRLNEHASAA